MRKFKIVNSGYLSCIGEGTNGEEITEDEYKTLLSVIQSKPPRTETADYKLRTDLTWEEYELKPPDPDPEIDDSEFVEMLLGVIA